MIRRNAKRIVLYSLTLPAIVFMVITYSNRAEACNSNTDYARLGFAALSQEEFSQAIDQFDCAISLEPTNADHYIYRGIAHRSLVMNMQALRDLNRGISLQSEDITLSIGAYTQRGNIHRERGSYTQAIADYSALINLTPNDVVGYRLRADAYYQAEQYRNAINDYSTILSFLPDDLDTVYNRGIAYYALADYEPAIADITLYIYYNHESSEAYTYAGNIYLVTGSFVDALNHYSAAVDLDANNLSALWGVANAHHLIGNTQFALDYYRAYIRLAEQQGVTPEADVYTRIGELEG